MNSVESLFQYNFSRELLAKIVLTFDAACNINKSHIAYDVATSPLISNLSSKESCSGFLIFLMTDELPLLGQEGRTSSDRLTVR